MIGVTPMALEYVLAATIAYAGASGVQQTMPVVGTFASHSACMQAVTDAQVDIKRRDPKAMAVIGGGTLCKPQEVRQEVFQAPRQPGERLPGQDVADQYKRDMMESLARHTREMEEANARAAKKTAKQ